MKPFHVPMKLKPEFFFSTTENHLQLINVAKDDAVVFRLTGECQQVFLAISKGQTLAHIKETLLSSGSTASEQEVDTFLASFLEELEKLDIFDV